MFTSIVTRARGVVRSFNHEITKPHLKAFDTLRNLRHLFSVTPEEIIERTMQEAGYDEEAVVVTSSWKPYVSRSIYDLPNER
jgi:hypothetical protein